MKTYLFTFVLMLLGSVAFAQPKLYVASAEFKMGQIAQGVPAEGFFVIENKGNQPLILSNVSASCGCTAPEWPKNPILEGEKAIIKAVYNAANLGVFNKSITVHSNSEQGAIVLRITGEVVPKKE